MKYLLLLALVLVSCQGQEIPKEFQKELQKPVEAKPKVEATPEPEPDKKDEEVDPSRLKTLEQKVNFIMDIIVKDVDCSKKKSAARPALDQCQERCDQDFPEPEDPEDPPPALVNGVCVQTKLAHPPENKQNSECHRGCWKEFDNAAKCSE